MYYKVMKDDKVIDVLSRITYLKYKPRYQMMVLSTEADAQGFLSSDGEKIWHGDGMYKFPIEGYDTVSLVEIDQYEYEQLKILNGKTPEEIIDLYTKSLLEEGML